MFESIPAELRQYNQWILWKYEDKGKEKPDKVPYTIEGKLASVSDPSTWATFDQCLHNVGIGDGIGFVLTTRDPFCCIDLDYTQDPTLIEVQKHFVNVLDCYSELSPSGKGLHLWCKAALQRGRRRGPFEIYSQNRFMTMTGRVYENKSIPYCQLKVEALLSEIGLCANEEKTVVKIDMPETMTDLAVWEMASNASNGVKFQSLWNGDYTTYHFGDQSRADFALIDILAFYTKNRNQIRRMFRQSGLGKRDKAKRDDYVENMIERSFDNQIPEMNFDGLRKRLKPYSQIIDKPEEKYEGSGPLSMPPGLLGEIAHFIYQQSYKPVAEMSIVGALGFMAGLCGRAYNISNTGLNLYLLLLARTGRGKEEIARGISKLVASMQLITPTIQDFGGPGDLASGQALLRVLTTHKTGSMLSIFGEFGIRLKAMCKAGALSSELMLQKVLLDLYNKSGATDRLMPTAYSDAERNTQIIHSPAFSMIGESTPDWFYDNVDESMISSGLLPRFCIVEYLGQRPPSNTYGQYVKPEPQMIERIAILVSVVQGLLQATQRCEVQMDEDGKRLSKALDERADDQINSSDGTMTAELWNRAHLKTLRVAGLLAVGKNPYAPVVDQECWMWAERFVLDSIESLSRRFREGEISSNQEEVQLQIVKRILASYLVEKPRSRVITDKLFTNAVIPYKYISQSLTQHRAFNQDRAGSAYAIRRNVQQLIDEGILSQVSPLQVSSVFETSGKLYSINQCVLED